MSAASTASLSDVPHLAGQDLTNYVLDTNVLLHDPTALFRFAEHNIYLPMAVLEELDGHKKGLEDLARHARKVTRQIAELIGSHTDLEQGLDLTAPSKGAATGRLFLTHISESELLGLLQKMGLSDAKADSRILATAKRLASSATKVVLVTKDVNLRVKALTLGISAQDYKSDRVVTDTDLVTPGYCEVEPDFWEQNAPEGESAFYRSGRGAQASKARVKGDFPLNSFITVRDRAKDGLWRVEQSGSGECVLHQVQTSTDAAPASRNDDSVAARSMLPPRDVFQSMAQDLLYDPSVDAVSLLGLAGSGKTLLALAAGLEQTKAGKYTGIIVTRATVSLGDDIGFLPGTEEEKMHAWLGGTLEDCLDVLGLNARDKRGAAKPGLPPELSVRSMSFMRGRSFHRKFIIIDEAQNLTQSQMKALITRVGNDSKIVLAGNIAQIDTPYLDEASSGLVWAVRTLSGFAHAGHVILPHGARSRLATHIEQSAQAKG